MSDRSLIFNAKGVQIGYIEADRAFDLTGRERCKYVLATGNLSELDSEKTVGHVSLDGTFVGLSWISDELFGKPSDEVNPGRITRNQRPRYRPKKANTPRLEQSSMKKSAPQPKNAVEDPQPFTSPHESPQPGLNTSEKAADEVPIPYPDTASDAPDQIKSTNENEVLGRAIDMIRSALGKGAE